MATFTVTNLNDSGPGSLRAAITVANADSSGTATVINFTVNGTITLNSCRRSPKGRRSTRPRRRPPVVAMGAEWQVAATGDFNGDGDADILWHAQAGGGCARVLAV